MNHGTATTKINIDFTKVEFSWCYFRNLTPPPEILEAGQTGVITAYLPEWQKFAISLSNGAHITFNMNEKEFKNLFDIKLN